jgi:hypothetical protein
LIEIVNMEYHVDPVVAVLDGADTWQAGQLIGDRASMACAGSQVLTAVRVDVAVFAGDYDQPRVVKTGPVATLGVIAFVVRDAVTVAELLFQINTRCH